MKVSKIFIVSLVVLFVTSSSLAYAQHKFHRKYNKWDVYVGYPKGGKKECFIVSHPINQAGNYTRRGQVYLMVVYAGDGLAQVSKSPGYNYSKDKKEIMITIRSGSGRRAKSVEKKMITHINRAWTKDQYEDAKLIKLMKAGNRAIVTGESTKRTWSLDTYSLMGFTKAYNEMLKLCRKGRR